MSNKIALFALRQKRFYLANAVFLPALAAGFYLASQAGYYRAGFFGATFFFLFWIFNVDQLRRCPFCHQRARSKEALLARLQRCGNCGSALTQDDAHPDQ